MNFRTLAVSLSALIISTGVYADNSKPSIKDGDRILLSVTGEVAIEFAKLYGIPVPPRLTGKGGGLNAEFLARISVDEQEQINIEHSVEDRTGERMITLIAKIDKSLLSALSENYRNTIVERQRARIAVADGPKWGVKLSDISRVQFRLWQDVTVHVH